LRRKPCTVLVQGKHRREIALQSVPVYLPQSAAGAGKENFDEMTEHPRHR
jgi:hypothetical protein